MIATLNCCHRPQVRFAMSPHTLVSNGESDEGLPAPQSWPKKPRLVYVLDKAIQAITPGNHGLVLNLCVLEVSYCVCIYIYIHMYTYTYILCYV